MKKTLNMRQQLSINLRYCYSSRNATQNVGDPQLAHHWYKLAWLIAISSHCLTTLPANISAFNSYMRQNAYYRDLKCICEDLLPCFCYVTKDISRTIRSRVSQPASAGKEADLVNYKLITTCYQNSEPDFCAV